MFDNTIDLELATQNSHTEILWKRQMYTYAQHAIKILR